MKKIFCSLSLILTVMLGGCSSVTVFQQKITEYPLSAKEILFCDVRNAVSKCLDDLFLKNILKKDDEIRVFVLVAPFNSTLLRQISSEDITQNIRMALLLTDKVVTAPLPENKKIPSGFDFLFSGRIVKIKLNKDSRQAD